MKIIRKCHQKGIIFIINIDAKTTNKLLASFVSQPFIIMTKYSRKKTLKEGRFILV